MESFAHFNSICDIKLKPRLLRTLIQNNISSHDDDGTFPAPPELSHVVDCIKNFDLLSESLPEPIDSNLAGDWKSASDLWFRRLLSLVSDDSNINCWTGTYLLGVSSLHCCSDRFLMSYSVWLDKLLQCIEKPAELESLRSAAFTSVTEILTRLDGFEDVHEDAISNAMRFIQPLLKLFNQNNSEALLEGAVSLLCTIINFFPSCMNQHHIAVEAAIIPKFFSGKYSVNILKKYAHCLALLPKSSGEEDSWSTVMQKLLISIVIDMDNAFTGLKEGIDSSELNLVEPRQLVNNRVPALMLCCCNMLKTHFPSQELVPVGKILAIIWSVLMVDSSLYQPTSSPITAAVEHEFVSRELSVLHVYSLDLLVAVINKAADQLLEYSEEIVRGLTNYFRICTLDTVRIKLYSVIKILLLSLGVGVSYSIDDELISNVLTDLECTGFNIARQISKKRKRNIMIDPRKDPDHKTRPLAKVPLKIAALGALEILLSVGGNLSSRNWRPSIDVLIVDIATYVFNGGRMNCEIGSTSREFQLTALRALLSCLLSQRRIQPSHLFRGLEIFQKGKEETGTKVAEFCAHALLTLDVLIHPIYTLPATRKLNCGSSRNTKSDGQLKSSGEKNVNKGNACNNGKRTETLPSTDMEMKALKLEPAEVDVRHLITDFREGKRARVNVPPAVKESEERWRRRAGLVVVEK